MKKIIIGLLMAFWAYGSASPCTIVMLSDQNNAIAGSNEDSYIVFTKIWFEPGSNGEYSKICLGYDFNDNSIQGGMNEMGLFIDGNALGPKGWKADPDKIDFKGKLFNTILANCASVEDVKQFFNKYNVKALNNARFPVMDKSGASMVVEWYNGKVVFLESEKSYQVATNFVGSEYLNKEKPCWRYNNSIAVLEKNNIANIENVKNALGSAKQNNKHAKTVYSFVCDLKKGEVSIYNWQNFDTPVKFTMKELNGKGFMEKYLFELFDPSPEYTKFIKNGIFEMVNYGYRENNIDVALWFYDICMKKYYDIFGTKVKPTDLYKIATSLVEEKKNDDALLLFKKNIESFPEHTDSFIATAEIYDEQNEYFKAMKYYALALDLDHNNKETLTRMKAILEKTEK